jgi:hypothetical protein
MRIAAKNYSFTPKKPHIYAALEGYEWHFATHTCITSLLNIGVITPITV